MKNEIFGKELKILKSFIEFINAQTGVYCSIIGGFTWNKVRIERQIPRVQKPVGRKIKDGQEVIMWESVEDPTLPDCLHIRIIKANDYININSEAEFNEQQICWAIIIFIFAKWDEEIRPQIAKIRGIDVKEIKINEFGDLRILRHSVVHNGGILEKKAYSKLTVMQDIVISDSLIQLNHEQMYKLFRYL